MTRMLTTTAAILMVLASMGAAQAKPANPYADGDPESDQSYVPRNKVAFAAGYMAGGGCNDAYRLPDDKDTYLEWGDSMGDYASGEYSGQRRGQDAKWCLAQKKILRDAGMCLHGRFPSTIEGKIYGPWGNRRPECTLPVVPEPDATPAADTVRDTRKARRLAFETPAMKAALDKVAASFRKPTPGRDCDHNEAMLLCEMENGETISVQTVPVKMSKAAAARECTNPYADGPEDIRVETKGGNPKQGFMMLWCVTTAAEGAKEAARKRMAAADPKASDMPLTDTVRIYAPINAIAIPCNVEALKPAENSAMLEGVKSDPTALALLRRLHRETQAAYVTAREAGDKRGFCDRFIANNSQYVRAR